MTITVHASLLSGHGISLAAEPHWDTGPMVRGLSGLTSQVIRDEACEEALQILWEPPCQRSCCVLDIVR